LAKLVDIPVVEKATVNVKPGTMPIASTLCIAIHRTTVKNTARTLENLAKAIQDDPLDGEKHRPANGGVCSACYDVVNAIRLISPFLNAYKSVTKRR
jgi:exocyst complex protein 7